MRGRRSGHGFHGSAVVGVLIGFGLLVSGEAGALTLADVVGPDAKSITVSDRHGYKGIGPGWEDNETEPGCVLSQAWDLEGMFLSQGGTKLTLVGGFDFVNGVKGYSNYLSGDIFLNTYSYNNTTVYGDAGAGTGSGQEVVRNAFGYDYVIDLGLDDAGAKPALVADAGNSGLARGSYVLRSINGGSEVRTVQYGTNASSNPWTYVAGGTDASQGMFLYGVVTDTPFLGMDGDGAHYALQVDLAGLAGRPFTAHFTMGCGNDNLVGQTPVPEPGTMALLGTGLLGFAGVLRRRAPKS